MDMTRDFFNYNGTNPKIKHVEKKANELVNSEEFIQRIKNKPNGFYLANCNGTTVANCIKEIPCVITVELYTSKNPFTSSNGYYTPSKPTTVHLNTRKLGRTNASLIATLVHEMVHLADGYSIYSFGHDSNTHTPEKEDCAPFWIDNLAESMISGVPMDQLDLRTKSNNLNIKFVPVWYKRIFMPWKWF